MRSEFFLLFLLLLCIALFTVDAMLILTVKKLNTDMGSVVVYSKNGEVSVKTGGELYRILRENARTFTLFEGEYLKITADGSHYLLRFLNNIYDVSVREVEVRLEKWER